MRPIDGRLLNGLSRTVDRSTVVDRCWLQHLKLKHNVLLSSIGFNFTLRQYKVVEPSRGGRTAFPSLGTGFEPRVGEAGPVCATIVYRCTRTHSPIHPPLTVCSHCTGVPVHTHRILLPWLFAHTVPVYPYTLADSSSLTVCS